MIRRPPRSKLTDTLFPYTTRFRSLGVVDGAGRDHFDFEVGARQRQLPVLDLHQQVGQHGQGLASFDDVDHLAQRLDEYFALQTETHAGSFPYALASDRKSVVSGKSVSVRVDLGGRRIIKKNIKHVTTIQQQQKK